MAIKQELPGPQQKLLEELRSLLSSDKNYANLRVTLKNVDLPIIPYLGMFLTDLTFIEDGNPNRIGQLVNVNKRRFVGGVISDILFYQQAPYNLEAVPFLQDWLKNLPSLHKDAAYARSLEILPRVAKGGGTLKGQTEEDEDDYGPLEEIKTYAFYEKVTRLPD